MWDGIPESTMAGIHTKALAWLPLRFYGEPRATEYLSC